MISKPKIWQCQYLVKSWIWIFVDKSYRKNSQKTKWLARHTKMLKNSKEENWKNRQKLEENLLKYLSKININLKMFEVSIELQY